MMACSTVPLQARAERKEAGDGEGREDEYEARMGPMTITGGDQTRFRNEPKKQTKRQAARRLTKTTNESHSATMCGWLHPFTTKQREPTAKHAQAHANRPTLSKRLCGSPTATLALCQDHDSGSHTGRRKTRKRAIRGKPPPLSINYKEDRCSPDRPPFARQPWRAPPSERNPSPLESEAKARQIK